MTVTVTATVAQWPHMSASVNRLCVCKPRCANDRWLLWATAASSRRTEEQAEQVESESENQQMPGKVGGTRWRKLLLLLLRRSNVAQSRSRSRTEHGVCDVATTRSDESNGRITTELKIKCYPSNMPPKNNDDDEMATATATRQRQHGKHGNTAGR